jgi:molecular chaperone DnaK
MPKNLLVFDFGGGTCDVALFKVFLGDHNAISVSTVSVSSYHRLGGGDIDTAILHEILIPELCRQNNLNPRDLTYEDKKMRIEPVLLNAAEKLKISLCETVADLIRKNEYNGRDKALIVSRVPEAFSCRLSDGNRECRLSQPSLNAVEFEAIMAPFLDTELLYARDTEYRLTCSVFSPIMDCLNRCGMGRQDIHACLLAGGSSLIPAVAASMKAFLPNAVLLDYPDRESAQTTVSRGAAYHAMALAVSGKSIITPVCLEGISMQTLDGPVEIVPKGVRLPYPANGFCVFSGLAVPEQSVLEPLKIRVELLTTGDEKPVYAGLWTLENNVVNKGDPIRMEYRYDENQNLWLRLMVDDGTECKPFDAQIENPLTQMINPNRAWTKILDIEEDLRTGSVSKTSARDRIIELTDLLIEVGRKEKAADYLKWHMNVTRTPDLYLLNRLGLLYYELGNARDAEKMYHEAVKCSATDGTPLFNLSLLLEKQGRIDEALEAIDRGIAAADSASYKVQKGLLLRKKGMAKEGQRQIEESLKTFKPVETQSEWELGWFSTAAGMVNRKSEVERADAAIREKAKKKEEDKQRQEVMAVVREGVLPMLTGAGKSAA